MLLLRINISALGGDTLHYIDSALTLKRGRTGFFGRPHQSIPVGAILVQANDVLFQTLHVTCDLTSEILN